MTAFLSAASIALLLGTLALMWTRLNLLEDIVELLTHEVCDLNNIVSSQDREITRLRNLERFN